MCALFGGYIFANAAAILLAQVLWGTQGSNMSVGLMFAFVFYSIAVIITFAAQTAAKAWLWVIGSSIVFLCLGFLAVQIK